MYPNMMYGPIPELTITSIQTLCLLQSRLQHIYHGRGTLCQSRDLNPMPESILFPSQVLLIWPQEVTFADTFIKLYKKYVIKNRKESRLYILD
jgi:hypothetical protein